MQHKHAPFTKFYRYYQAIVVTAYVKHNLVTNFIRGRKNDPHIIPATKIRIPKDSVPTRQWRFGIWVLGPKSLQRFPCDDVHRSIISQIEINSSPCSD
jgi:hypothetical protein